MTSKEHLIEQHILEYEARRKHIEELYQRAHEVVQHLDESHGSRAELDAFAKQHNEATQKAEAIKSLPADQWRKDTIQSAGPMAIWDILAQKLEDFVERHEK